jgi:hypothetical protein
MNRLLPLTVMLAMVSADTSELSALEKSKAAYAGGTIAVFNDLPARIEGHLDLGDPHALVFVPNPASPTRPLLRIRYSSIHDLEFGQKVRRRIAAATVGTALFGPIGALAFAAKKREHYLTVLFTDDRGLNQVAILELGKHVVRSTLGTIEARSGTVVEYQDEAARRWR